jgi:hypothetical protein
MQGTTHNNANMIGYGGFDTAGIYNDLITSSPGMRGGKPKKKTAMDKKKCGSKKSGSSRRK